MAPLLAGDATLAPRYYCGSGYYYSNGYCYSRWSWWGRWVLTGVIVFLFLVFVLYFTYRNRHLRRNRAQTRFGPQSGWFSRPQYASGAPQYNPAGPQYSAPPPQYSPPGGTNQGYYAPNGGDIPLQQPANAYYPVRGVNGEEDYAAPEGPPPAKK